MYQKPSLIALLLVFVVSVVSAQSSCVKFTYDSAGNRTSRNIAYNCGSVDDPCDVPGGCNPLVKEAGDAVSSAAVNSTIKDGVSSVDQVDEQDALTSLEEKETIEKEVLLYPNPNSGVFKIELKGFDGEVALPILIFDPTGRIVYRKTLGSISTTLFLENLSSGTYIMKFPSLEGKTLFVTIIQ